ncbi:hypothetical protein FB45DRAFT_1039895 [Roridomyces roridus]|uniref:Uncharacterized protein n=1 Tax=Roridomyces roridus TaxID=1738132 RepID=A0AAD7B289_9AGAR|nr:hypothetical protein FB45DRAFT_1039895 [Roridomyces roridus]
MLFSLCNKPLLPSDTFPTPSQLQELRKLLRSSHIPSNSMIPRSHAARHSTAPFESSALERLEISDQGDYYTVMDGLLLFLGQQTAEGVPLRVPRLRYL